MSKLVLSVMAVLLVFSAMACGSDEVPEGYELVSNVSVALGEWSITPSPNSVPAGLVRFTASNGGPADPHELVIFRTNLPVDELERIAIANPEERGFLPEEGVSGVEFIGEIEEFDVGQQSTGVYELAAGNYMFICNIVEPEELDEDGNAESHLLEGMSVAFTVN